MRILYMGSPEVAVPFLQILNTQEEVIGVVTQKDKPAGRGYKLTPPPVKEAAMRLGLKVWQPDNIKNNPEFLELLKTLDIDLIVVNAFGRILPNEILKIPKIGSINIHFSILPKYRGPAPVQWAIINGEKETGVTIFWMNEKIDAGEIISQQKIGILPEDNYITIISKLTEIGISLLKESLNLIKEKRAPRTPQPILDSPVYAPLLKKEDGKINWNKSCVQIHNLTRALISWPQAYTKYKTEDSQYKILKILQTTLYSGTSPESFGKGSPGEILDIIKNEGIVIKCGEGYLLIKKVKLESGKAMSSDDFTHGHKVKIGDIFE